MNDARGRRLALGRDVKGLDLDGCVVRRPHGRHHTHENRDVSEATSRWGEFASPSATKKSGQKLWEGEYCLLTRAFSWVFILYVGLSVVLSSGHDHSVQYTADDFSDLQAGKTIAQVTTGGSPTHRVAPVPLEGIDTCQAPQEMKPKVELFCSIPSVRSFFDT